MEINNVSKKKYNKTQMFETNTQSKERNSYFKIKYIFSVKNENHICNPFDISATIEYRNDTIQEYSSLVILNKSLYNYLNDEKNKICSNENLWDILKKQTNPYEYVYSNLHSSKLNVSKIKPISRAFFKFIEIYIDFNFIEEFKNTSIQTFHCAEGPGGFIEALCYLRRKYNKTEYTCNDSYIGMTLYDSSNDLPNWNKMNEMKQSKKLENFTIETGYTKDGDILNVDNFEYVSSKYRSSMDLVTGDAGVDFSNKYTHQEYNMLKLLIAQFCYAVLLQKKGGSFILKVFDLFMKPSVELIYLINCFYTNVYIVKPKTSRIANSEKYIVCKNFTFDKEQIEYYVPNIKLLFQNINVMNENCFLKSILKNEMSYTFLKKIESINASIGQKQLLNIHETNELIQEQTDKINRFDIIHLKFSYSEKNIEKHLKNALEWCKYYDIPCKEDTIKDNIFRV